MTRERVGGARAWLAGLVLLVGCAVMLSGVGVGAGARHIPQVLATTTQVYDLARNVAGTAAHVDSILAANVDPHDYEPVPSDLKKIAAADVILENGVGLEQSWMIHLLQSKRRGVPVVEVSRGVHLLPGSKENPQGDPHVWFAVPNAALMATNIGEALATADPASAGYSRANVKRYVGQLDDLDKYISRQIATLPPSRRKLVTSHDALGYYVNRYGLKLVGAVIPSTTTEAQASAKHLAELVAQIRAEHVKAVFVESSVNPKLSEQIGREAGVRVVTNLYGDTLGPAGSDGDTYLKMMRHNTDLIVSSLR